jgi:hypothetical protein
MLSPIVSTNVLYQGTASVVPPPTTSFLEINQRGEAAPRPTPGIAPVASANAKPKSKAIIPAG